IVAATITLVRRGAVSVAPGAFSAILAASPYSPSVHSVPKGGYGQGAAPHLSFVMASRWRWRTRPRLSLRRRRNTRMLMSSDRILVSHVGSLPRPDLFSELLIRQEAGETVDPLDLARQVETATAHVIDKQV